MRENRRKTIIKRTLLIMMLISICIMSITFTKYGKVFAIGSNTNLEIQSNNIISIDPNDENKLVYKIGEVIVGNVKVKSFNEYVTPTMDNGKAMFSLREYVGESYQVSVEVVAQTGYRAQPSYFYQQSSDSFPGDGIINLDITSNSTHLLDFKFEEDNQPGPQNPNQPGPQDPNQPGPQVTYPVVAYFEGIESGVEMTQDGSIRMPNNWTSGKVTFKAKTCKVNGNTAPDDGFNIPDPDSQEEIAVRIEGIANGSQINGSVTGTREYVNISENFNQYGKATIHITSVEENGPVNTIINITTNDLINIKATAPLSMSFSVGSSAVDQAIITQNVVKNLSIFFGNSETTLIVSGPNVDKITAVNNNGNEVTLNEDGSATIKLPDLSVETTTQVKVTILLKDGASIVRTVNIRRTAIMLEYDDRENSLRAGYVMNKAYLYNNQAHNDDIFNAYLQVILYKDNVVAGYKQVKINDEEIVNRLQNNEAWSIEAFSEEPIVLYNGTPEGVNKVSVFLTNGPIDFESETLPSVEFGIGSGVTVEFGGEE